jgi:lycopene cyclase domain-containing protein
LVPLAATTAVFDNLIVGFKIVAYDSSKVSGISIGCAPIEDFCYSLAAIWLLPAIWRLIAQPKRTG